MALERKHMNRKRHQRFVPLHLALDITKRPLCSSFVSYCISFSFSLLFPLLDDGTKAETSLFWWLCRWRPSFWCIFFSPFLSRPRPTGGRKLNDRFMLLKKKKKNMYTRRRKGVPLKKTGYVCAFIYIYIKKRRKEIPTERPGVEKNVTDASDRAFFFPSIFCVCVCCNIPRTPFSGAPVLVVVSGTLFCVFLYTFLPCRLLCFTLFFCLLWFRNGDDSPSRLSRWAAKLCYFSTPSRKNSCSAVHFSLSLSPSRQQLSFSSSSPCAAQPHPVECGF